MRKAPKKILVSLKEAASAEELISLATHVAADKAPITILNVNEIPEPTPLDADDPALDQEARAVEQAVKRLARRYRGRRLLLRLARARHAGRAIVEELKEGKYDLAVIGYHHKRSLGELLLGTTAQYLARHAPCRLLMCVPPKP
ncbi:MAG TPA: universal stress protein [Candidatus Xenobia bacterium]|nr:universal stress protein [Candidatus Xenobia bacterium]